MQYGEGEGAIYMQPYPPPGLPPAENRSMRFPAQLVPVPPAEPPPAYAPHSPSIASIGARSQQQQQALVDHDAYVAQQLSLELNRMPANDAVGDQDALYAARVALEEAGHVPRPPSSKGPVGAAIVDQAALHEEMARLEQDEKQLLASPDLTPYEQAEIREQFFHQKMSLMMRMPDYEQKQYHPAPPRMSRMGTVRSNWQGESQVKYRPVFCILVFLVCCIMFLVSIGKNGWSIESYANNPMIGPSTLTLNSLGAKNAYVILHHGQVWRFLSAIFLHAGIIHLLMNMLVVLRLGVSMEEAFGTWRVAVIFILSGIFGMLGSCLFLPGAVTVGASGALFGLIGALFGDFVQNHKTMEEGKWSYFIQLTISTIVGLCVGLLPLLDNFAHIFGFVSGFLLGLTLLGGAARDERGKRIWSKYGKHLMVICGTLTAVLYVVAFASFFGGTNGSAWCSGCLRLSCLDTPWWSCASTRALENCSNDPTSGLC